MSAHFAHLSDLNSQERVTRVLRGYGLKPYEIRVYLDILKHGVSTAKDVMRRTKIPYGRIYSVIKSLCSKGYIQEYPSIPKTYRASNPFLLIKTLIDEEEKKLKLMYEQADSLRRELSKITYGNGARYLIATIITSPEIIVISSKQIAYSKSSIDVCLDICRLFEIYKEPCMRELWDSYIRILEQALSRGVALKLLIGTYDSEDKLSKQEIRDLTYALLSQRILRFKPTVLQIRCCNPLPISFNVYDNERVLIKLKDPTKEGSYMGGILIFDLEFAKILKNKFNAIWSQSKEL